MAGNPLPYYNFYQTMERRVNMGTYLSREDFSAHDRSAPREALWPQEKVFFKKSDPR